MRSPLGPTLAQICETDRIDIRPLGFRDGFAVGNVRKPTCQPVGFVAARRVNHLARGAAELDADDAAGHGYFPSDRPAPDWRKPIKRYANDLRLSLTCP